MVEYTRDKILPEDLIQKTNLQQHNFMITAINDIDGWQADIEDITNVNIDDIADLKTDVVALSNEKLDKADIDADLHFGDISVTRDGTAVLMSLDVFNPTTGIVTPISFTIPGATSALAGSMDASSVAWIADAENRISALEGLSDVKAVSGLSSEPTQEQLNYAWVAATSKQAETGDIIQDVNNAKLWVFITDTWILYGTLVVVPMATTTSIGGIKDTALNTVGNRWYCHVEADGRIALIGGDVLSTLVDTTVPGIQTALDGKVGKTGDEEIYGTKTFRNGIYQKSTLNITEAGYSQWTIDRLYDVNNEALFDDQITKDNYSTARQVSLANKDANGIYFSVDHIEFVDKNKNYREFFRSPTGVMTQFRHLNADGTGFSITPYRPYSQAIDTDILTKGHVADILAPKQDKLTFDTAPTTGSANPVTSGGVYTALDTKQDKFSLYEHTIRVWTTAAPDKFRFSLTVLNQSPTEFTLPTLRSYLGTASGGFKQCSGLGWSGSLSVDLIGVRGGAANAFFFEGVERSAGADANLSLNWTLVEVLCTDKVRQIV